MTAENGAGLADAEREQLREAFSEWAPKEAYPRKPQFARVVEAVERILSARNPPRCDVHPDQPRACYLCL
jgi:hypothetical protein